MNYFLPLFWLLFIGRVENYRFKRIIGGEINRIENVPYMLSLRLAGFHICGAAIISENWSITAAHCCVNNGAKLTVRSNSSSYNQGGKLHNVTNIHRHKKYRYGNDNFDLCLMQVTPPFELSLAVKLQNPDQHVNVTKGLFSGWGPTEKESYVLSPIIQSAQVTKIDLEKCRELYNNIFTIHDTNSCYENGYSDACKGDSGGALVNDENVLIGITSFGFECGFKSLPGVFVDILQFRTWIKDVTGV